MRRANYRALCHPYHDPHDKSVRVALRKLVQQIFLISVSDNAKPLRFHTGSPPSAMRIAFCLWITETSSNRATTTSCLPWAAHMPRCITVSLNKCAGERSGWVNRWLRSLFCFARALAMHRRLCYNKVAKVAPRKEKDAKSRKLQVLYA